VFMVIANRAALQPVRLGLELAATLWKLYGTRYSMENTDRLLGSRQALERVKAGEDPGVVSAEWSTDEARWRQLRAKIALTVGAKVRAPAEPANPRRQRSTASGKSPPVTEHTARSATSSARSAMTIGRGARRPKGHERSGTVVARNRA
jgi:hypothetical protein